MPIITRNEPAQAYRATDSAARVSTTVLAIDTDLQIPVSANTTYMLELGPLWTNAGAGDFKWGLGGPVGAMAFEESLGISGQDIGASVDNMSDTSGANNGSFCKRIKIKTGSTAGVLAFYWAQSVSDAGATVLKAGSHMTLEKIGD